MKMGFCSACFASGVEVVQVAYTKDNNPNSGRYICKKCIGDIR